MDIVEKHYELRSYYYLKFEEVEYLVAIDREGNIKSFICGEILTY